jgi:hypothetical protein
MSRRLLSNVILISALPLCGLAAANAQIYTLGSIAGTVFDPSGAVVPAAAVTIHNDGTNAEIELKRDGSGYFKASNISSDLNTRAIDDQACPVFREICQSSNS